MQATILQEVGNLRNTKVEIDPMKHHMQKLLGFVVTCLLALSPAVASDVGLESVTLEKAKLSLLDGGEGADGRLLAGLSMNLASGVKTYWRMPGDSGLPPIFDFSASRNVERVEIAWPVPSRLPDADGTILGYQDRVIFPLLVTPKDPKQPVSLTLTIDFGLCDTLCVPAKATLTRSLASGGAARSSIESFLARAPKKTGLNGTASPSVMTVEAKTKTPAALVLSVRSSSPLQDVIIEGPETWYFGQPTITRGEDGVYRVMAHVEQKPSSATFGGLDLTITAIAEDGATETGLALDATGSIQ